VFAALAMAALGAAAARDRWLVGRVARDPVVLTLIALAALGAASAAWTIGSPADALRWGAATAGYAAVAITAATLVGRDSRWVDGLATFVCIIAAVSGFVGLVAAATHTAPYADRIAGGWRPGGTLQYSPALALLQVSALPALLTAAMRRRGAVRALAAAGIAIAGSVIALSESRTAIALAALTFVCAAVAAVTFRRVALVGLVLVIASVGMATQHAAATSGARPDGGFWHGRLQTWRAAGETAADRPVAGAGADAFLAASARHQRAGPVRFAHDLPLELGAELGVAGALLAMALYASAGIAVWRARATRAGWLLGPPALAFLLSGLLDWPWHLAGSGAVWAMALGGVLGSVRVRG
jgi:O-antigen ligase